MRLVLDTNIVISGLLWHGAPARLMAGAFAGKFDPCVGGWLITELGNSLGKPHLIERLKRRGYSAEIAITVYQGLCEFVQPVALEQRIAPDPDDDWVIATAIAAHADLIVTGDKPLLGVGSVGAIRIVTVAKALELAGAL